MKTIFAHDHIFYNNKGKFYSTGGLSNSVLNRYVKEFGELNVLSRHKSEDIDEKKYVVSSGQNIEFTEIPNFKSIKSFLTRRKAKRIVENEVLKADMVVARLPSSIGTLAIDAAEKFNKPYIVEVVACPLDAYSNHSFIGRMIAPIMYISMKKRVGNAKYVTYVTKNFLQNRYPTSGVSTSVSDVELVEFDNKVLDRRLEKINNKSNKDYLIIGTIGGIDIHYKGQESVIKAIKLLEKKQQETIYYYQMVGNGNPEYLEKIIRKYKLEDKIKILGNIPHKEIFSWLDNIDIYIQPSKTEGLPRALVEALSRGVPSIGTKVGGIPELLDNDCLVSVNRNNSEEIKLILEEMTKSKMKVLAKENFERSKKYDKNKIEEKRNLFYERFKNETTKLKEDGQKL